MLLADALPSAIKTTVKQVNKDSIQLAITATKGMSGIVVHDYGNGLSAITHSVISLGGNQAKVIPYTAIKHEKIPSIQTAVAQGDEVILGNFYQNAFVLAPNSQSYENVIKKYNRIWTHPDAYALDFLDKGESGISLENIENFAKKYQIGLVLIVAKDKLRILDPVSHQFLNELSFNAGVETAMSPFYARFEQMSKSLFDSSDKTYTPYYQAIERLQ